MRGFGCLCALKLYLPSFTAHCFASSEPNVYPDTTPEDFNVVLHSHVMDLSVSEEYNENAKPK
jgi:hypothetical protein